MPLSELNGNYVVIKIGHRRFAFYAHIQPHSVRVHVGEHVTPGQVIGLLGNTGNTDAPHLHFQIMNGPDSWTADGLPFEFRSFGSEGTFTNKVEDLQKGKPAVIGPVSRGHHRDQLPLENEVISFPGEGKPPVTGRG
jgi:murein DD-endopeptidase MepM/ murein hydrolase activator NlpD